MILMMLRRLQTDRGIPIEGTRDSRVLCKSLAIIFDDSETDECASIRLSGRVNVQ